MTSKPASEPGLKADHLCRRFARGVGGRRCEGVVLADREMFRPDASIDLGGAYEQETWGRVKGRGDVADVDRPERVDGEGPGGIVPGLAHARLGRQVTNSVRLRGCHGRAQAIRVPDVGYFGKLQGLIAALLEVGDQPWANEAPAPGDQYAHANDHRRTSCGAT